MNDKNEKVYKIVVTGLMAALCYVAFTYLKIPIPTFGGDMVALHIGNAFCVLAALLLGGVYGGLAGSLGMTIADLIDPAYVTSAPKTFVLKLCIGLVTGFIAHRIAHITENHDNKYVFKWTVISSIAGLGFNVIMDPIAGFFYKNYILGVESSAAKIMSTWAAGVTFINSVAGTIVVVAVYMAVRPVLKKAGLFFYLSKDNGGKREVGKVVETGEV
ncbi:MAG: ECF transporter S component [Hungatella sp.]|nr:ECF transporter S component [Hungatella sp.]